MDAPGGSRALTMQALGSDMSTHLDVPGAAQWQDYEVTGRMMAEHPRGKFGVLINSQRLLGGAAIGLIRGQSGNTFRVSLIGAPPGSSCVGTSDTRFTPLVAEWQHFRLRTTTEAGTVRVRARVWTEFENEPAVWQADCAVTPGAVSNSGAFGVWSSGSSTKYWDDIEVRAVGGE